MSLQIINAKTDYRFSERTYREEATYKTNETGFSYVLIDTNTPSDQGIKITTNQLAHLLSTLPKEAIDFILAENKVVSKNESTKKETKVKEVKKEVKEKETKVKDTEEVKDK